jgi:hypothetical protein
MKTTANIPVSRPANLKLSSLPGAIGRLATGLKRAAGLVGAAGGSRLVEAGVGSLLERLEDRQLLTVDVAATIGTFTGGTLTSGGANQTLAGSIVLTNTGTQPVAGAAYRVFLAPLAGGDEITLGTGSVSLLPGAANARTINLNTLSVSAPGGGFATGAYTLSVELTNAGGIDDENSGNDFAVAAGLVAINGPAGPDLAASNLAIATQTVAPGTQLTGNNSVVFRNTGTANAGASVARWVISRDRNLGNALNLTQSGQAFAGLNAGANTTITPAALTVPIGTGPGAYFVGLVLDSAGAVTEANEGNNVVWTAAAVVTVALPELSATISYAGQTSLTTAPIAALTGTFTVRNTGTSAAQNFNVRVYATDSEGVEGLASIELLRPTGVLTIANLAPGASQTFSLGDFDAGDLVGINAGVYSIRVVVDTGSAVLESNESNNEVATATPSLVFNAPAGAPDVRVTSVVNPAGNATVGQDGTVSGVSVTITRTGGQVSNQDGERPVVLIGLATTNTLASQYIPLALETLSVEQVNTLNTTGTLTLSGLSLPLPVGVDTVSLGSYFLGAYIDFDQNVGETNEANNFAFATQRVAVAAPDLQGSFALSPATQVLNPGDPLSLSVTLRNTGTVASGAFLTRFLLVSTADTGLSAAQTGPGQVLGVVSPVVGVNAGLSAGQTLTLSDVRLALPTSIRPGSYRLVMIVDAGETVFEGNEANNITFSTGAVVTVPARGADTNGVDLSVTGPTSLVITQTGASATVRGRVAVANLGNQSAAGGLSVRAFLSTDRTLDQDDFELSEDIFGGQLPLLFSGTGSLVSDVQFSGVSGLPVGQFHLILSIDPDTEQAEISEANNVWASAGLIAVGNAASANSANLNATTGLVGTTNVQRGQNLSVPTTVRNTGPASAGASSVRYILSTNDVVGDADDVVLADATSATSFAVGAINSGAQATLSPTLVIPANLPAGVSAYRLIVQVDSGRAVDETNEADNTVVGTAAPAINVTAPNLTASTTFAAVTTSRGATINVPATVRNTGIITTGGDTTARIALRPIAATDASQDIVLGTRVIGTLAPGASEAFTQSFTLPTDADDLPAGDYRVVVTADSAGAVLETNEADNSAVSGAVLRIAAPNLTALAPTVAAVSVTQGGVVSGSVVVRNLAAAAAGAFSVRLLLSSDGTLSEQTDTLLTVLRLTGLAGNASQTLAFSAPVPSLAAGTYFIIAQVDSASEVEELVETDNASATAAARVTVTGIPNVGADLTARPLISSALALATGTSVTIPVQISNIGTSGPGAASVGRLLLSTNNTPSADDVEIGTFSIANGLAVGSSTVQVNATIPGFAGAGRYFVIAVADTGSEVTETNENNNFGATATALVTVSRPVVSIAATTAAAAETASGAAARNGVFRVTRTGPTTGALSVNVLLSGTATAGTDYTTNPAVAGQIVTVVIPAGQTSASFTISPTDDGLVETLTETVVATVARGDGYSTSGNPATVNITDRQTAATVTIAATDAAGAETAFGATRNGLNFRLTRTGGTLSQPLVVTLNWDAGEAVNGTDFGTQQGAALPTSFTIPANQATLNIPVFVLGDVAPEISERIIATIVSNSQDYRVTSEATRRATGTIANLLLGDARFVNSLGLTSPANIALTQPGSEIAGSYRVITDGPAQPVNVRYILSTDGTVGNADDINLGAESVIIQPGANQTVAFRLSLDGLSFIPQGSYQVIAVMTPTVGQAVERSNSLSLGQVNLTGMRADLSLNSVSLPTNFNYTLGGVTSLNIAPTAVVGNATPGVTVRNVGVRYVLTNNATLGDADDIALPSASVALVNAEGTAITGALNADLQTVAGQLSVGVWRVGAILGVAGDGVAALDTTPGNNQAISTQTITVTQGVNLAAGAVVVAASPANRLQIAGGSVTNTFAVNAVIQNLSSVSSNYTVEVLVNTVNDFVNPGATLLATRSGTLLGNTTEGITFAIADLLNIGALVAGSYFVALRITPTGAFPEVTPANNLFVSNTQLVVDVT